MTLMRKLTLTTVAALVVVAFAAAAAQACPYSEARQVFHPWGDRSSYVLAPDGGFEAGAAGWSLSGGARTADGNEAFFLNDQSDSKSLALPAGSSAVSPPICMSIDTPHFRLLARNTGSPTVLTLSTIVGTLVPSAIQVRITPAGGGDWAIDDLYVDPFARH